MRQCASHLTLAIVSITLLAWRTPIAKADVDVCGTVTITNNTGVDANDVHFNMYQDDRPEVTVTGASASSTNGSSTATQDSAHSANVDNTGCNVPAGGSIAIKVCLTMTERNCLKFRDVYFTQDGTPIPPGGGGGGGGGPPPPDGGWRVDRPYGGGSGGGGSGQGGQEGGGGTGYYVHHVCYENDDTVPMVITDLKLLASMSLYDTSTLDMSSIVSISDPANPYPICIPPGGKYCFDFQTTGAYVGGHVYQKWVVRQAYPGECGVPLIGGSALAAAAPPPPPDPNSMLIIGDHPVESLMFDPLPGDDFYTTIDPTSVTFGNTNDYQTIPADFFGPGSAPFTGTVNFHGQPLGSPTGNTDTIVERKSIAYLDNNGSSTTIPIEIVALSLVSAAPISVNVSDPNQPTFFDALTLTTQTGQPPAQIKLSITNDNISDGIEDLSLQSVNPPAMVIRGTASDTGGGVGLWGNIANFDVFFQPSGPIPSFPGSSSIKVACIIHSLGGSGFFPMPQSPQLQWTPFNSFFDVFYSVPITGVTDHFHIHYQIGPGQPLQIQSVNFGPSYNGNSLFDVNIVLQATGAIDNAQPLIQTVTSGYSSSTSTKFFDVFMTLDTNVVQPLGSMTITRTSNNGGTFTSTLPVRPTFTFTNVSNPSDVHVLDNIPPIISTQTNVHDWQYNPIPGHVPGQGPNFFPSSANPLQWHQPDGSPHTVNPGSIPPLATQWRSMRTHTGLGDLAIVLNPTASGNGVSGPTVETRNGGIQRIQVDFDQPVTLVGPIAVTEWKTVAGVMQPPTNYSPAASMLDPDTLELSINTTDEVCLNINLAGALQNIAGQLLTGDMDCNVRGLIGDVTGNGSVMTADMLATKAKIGQPVLPSNVRYDLILNGAINTADMLLAKSRVITPARQALCP